MKTGASTLESKVVSAKRFPSTNSPNRNEAVHNSKGGRHGNMEYIQQEQSDTGGSAADNSRWLQKSNCAEGEHQVTCHDVEKILGILFHRFRLLVLS